MTESCQDEKKATFAGRLLLEVKCSGYVRLEVGIGDLWIEGPFGTVTIPFSRARSAKARTAGGVEIVAEGSRLWLEVSDPTERGELLRLLQDRITKRPGTSG